MSTASHQLDLHYDEPISTWFHIGGRARRLARPTSLADLLACVELDDELRILGEGANLLVDDEGVSNLVVSLQQGSFIQTQIDEQSGLVYAG
ncbi:MAG: hypothetical protein NXI07_13030, partial [bacterium]|nr:hypothetical protein [bacterium]